MDTDAQQTAQLCMSIDKCLQHLRLLKSVVLNAHNILGGANEQTINAEKIKEAVERYAQQISTEYDKLETEAKALPTQTPPSVMIGKLNQFLLDCATNPQMRETYTNTRNVFDWSDSTANYINFAYDLFKISHINTLTQQRNRKLTLAHQWNAAREPVPLAIQMRNDPSSSQHAKFLEHFQGYMRHYQNQSMKLTEQPFEYRVMHKFLENSVLSSVIEIKYISVTKGRPSDGQMVCMQKFLLLANNGFIEYVHFIAPHEDWHYEEVPGISNKKQVDLGTQSRFELYQKLTIYGNVIVNMVAQQPVNVKLLHVFLQQMARLVIIDQQCSKCKKRLRDFTPVIDNMKSMPIHMACK